MDRLNLGQMENKFTLDDPGAYSKPITMTFMATKMPPQDELLEYICQENNRYGSGDDSGLLRPENGESAGEVSIKTWNVGVGAWSASPVAGLAAMTYSQEKFPHSAVFSSLATVSDSVTWSREHDFNGFLQYDELFSGYNLRHLYDGTLLAMIPPPGW